MFPIHSETGQAIAFGGRALSDEDQPKYLNSAETPIYKKSDVLYNLHRAKEAVRKAGRVVLVEGYMDVIGVFSSGVKEVVATCGTALTAQQVQTMKRLSDKICVNFDPDAARARSAAEKSISLLLEENMHVRIMELDGGLDPDEYCKERGAEAYVARMEQAKSYFYWLADRARERFDMRSAEESMAGLQFLLPAVLRLNDKLERLAVANELAGYLGVEAEPGAGEFPQSRHGAPETPMAAPRVSISAAHEKILLALLVASEEARAAFVPRLKSIAALEQFATRRVFQAIFALHDAGERITFRRSSRAPGGARPQPA